MPAGTPKKVKKRSKSVLKRIRQAERRTIHNRAKRTRVRTAIKAFRRALEARDVAAAEKLLAPTLSLIDRGVRLGVLHPNTASRYKSRLTLAYNALRHLAPASA